MIVGFVLLLLPRHALHPSSQAMTALTSLGVDVEAALDYGSVAVAIPGQMKTELKQRAV